MRRYAPPPPAVKRPGAAVLAAMVAGGVAVALLARAVSGGLLPLDDAYIYMQYAHRLADGHPFRYAPGEPATTGATSLAWLLITAACAIGAGGLNAPAETAVFLVEGALLGATLWMFLRLLAGEGVALRAALPATLLLPAMPVWLFGALNGMETLLYGAGLLLVVAVLRGASPWWLLVPAFARPMGVPLSLAVLACRWFASGSDRRVLAAVAAASMAGAIWPWLLTGHPSLTWTAKALPVEPRPDVRAFYIPKTGYFALRSLWFGISGALGQPPLDVARDLVKSGAWTILPWAAFHLGGLGLAIRHRAGRAAALLWVAATLECLLTVAWDGQDYRYLVGPLPLLVLAAAIGWGRAAAGRNRLPAAGACALLILVTLFPEPAWTRFHRLYEARSRDLAVTQAAAGRWIDAHLEPDARVAVHDAGAVAFFGGRPVVDLVGLVTPEMALAWRNGEGAVWEALSDLPPHRRPDHAALAPDWIPRLMKTGLFDRRVFTTRGGGGRVDFEVWRLAWPGPSAESGPGGDLSDIPAAFGPGAGQTALEIVDRVDIASLRSEAAHDCVFALSGDPRDPLTVVRDLGFATGAAVPGTYTLDGGRSLAGPVRFRLAARPGAPALLVVRTASPREAVVTVAVGDQRETLRIPRDESRFHEADVLIAAETIAGALDGDGRLDIRIEMDRSLVFHWWLLQPVTP